MEQENQKVFVITPNMFGDILKKFFEKLQNKNIVESFSIDKRDRTGVVLFNSKSKVPETYEDIVIAGLFKNIKDILKDMGDDNDIDDKLVTLPMYSTLQKGNRVEINY